MPLISSFCPAPFPVTSSKACCIHQMSPAFPLSLCAPFPQGSLSPCPPPARVALLHFGLFPLVCHLILGAGVAASPVSGPAREGTRPSPRQESMPMPLHATSPVIPCANPSSLLGQGCGERHSRRTRGSEELWCWLDVAPEEGRGEGSLGSWHSFTT